MHIALVSPFDPDPGSGPGPTRPGDRGAHVGGVERVFSEVSRRLAARGHQVTVVCSSAHRNDIQLKSGVQTVRVRRRGLILRAPVADLARFIPRSADLIHVAATYPFTTPGVLRKATTLGVPGVLDFHFEPAPGTPLGRLAAAAYRYIGPPNYRLAHTTLVRSLSYGRSAPSLRSIPEERWRVVPNGIDPERFHPLGRVLGGGHLLVVGRLVPYKGIEILLHALARIPEAPPLVIAGDGPLRKPLEALARRLGVAARFLGRVDDTDLPALYRGAALTILPSINRQEAFGISLLESMACGTPVVASALPGVADVAQVGGLVAPPGDPAALAACIQEALRNRKLPRGETLASPVRATYSWNAVTTRLLDIYEEILQSPSKPGSASGNPPQPHASEVTVLAHPLRHALL